MAKQAWETLVAFKLVWIRVALYVLLPALDNFTLLTKDIGQDEWFQMGYFDKAKFWAAVFKPGLFTFVAFIDQSLARAKAEVEQKRTTGNTPFLNRSDTGP